MPLSPTRRLLLASVLLPLCAPAVMAAPLSIGAVDKAQGEARAIQAGATRELQVEGPVFFRDRLRTGADARLNATLADGSQLTMGENGRMTVDEFVYTPGTQGGRLAVSIPTGAFLFVGGKVEGPTGGNVSINTPVGTLGVRGTTVWGGKIDGGFGVLVLDGLVTISTPTGDVTLQKGQGTMIYAKRAPTAAGPWPEDRVKRAVATISFDPEKQRAALEKARYAADGIMRKP